MNEKTDSQLLRAYAEQRSEAAFAELVRRYVDLVYSAARRMVCEPQLAQDVTQGTFVALARSANQLRDRQALSGWLHRTAQNIAAQTVRTDVRRRAREQEAAAMNQLLSAGSDTPWERIAPHLDDALGELSEPDRDALMLRYFENKSLRAVGQQLDISDDAAQKRISRAVERLRGFFAKRGVTVSASGLVVVISANAVQAAPVGLAVTISTAAALAGTTIATTATATATKVIAMTTLQKTLAIATVAVLVGVGSYEALLISRLREQNQTFRLQQAPLAEQIQQLQRERDEAANRLSALADEIQRAKGSSAELLKLRGEVGVLRQQAALDRANTKSPAEAVAKVMNDSSAVELARVQIRQTLKYRYSPLTQKLNLSPDATDKLFNLIIENELKKKVTLAQLLSGDVDAETALRSRDNAKTELESQIATLLGDSGFAQFDQFNHETAAGELVKGLNRELGDKALNDEQSKRIQALFGAKPDILMDDMDLFRSKESLDALLQTLVDRGHRDLQEAASFLTPEQLAAAYTIQSNYFNTIRNQMTLGQQLVNKTRKQSQ